MATTNYNIPTIDPTARIDIASDVNESLNSIDAILDTKANISYVDDKFIHKNVFLCGDSYSVEQDETTTDRYGIGHYLATMFENLTNGSICATGFCATYSGIHPEWHGWNFTNIISNATAEDIDTVIIAGGINDTGFSYDQIKTGCTNAINAAKTKWPAAKIYVIPSMNTWYLPTMSVYKVYRAVKDSCQENNVHCASYAWTWGVGKKSMLYMPGDDIHPNNTGAALFAKYIFSIVNQNIEDACILQYGSVSNASILYDHDVIIFSGQCIATNTNGTFGTMPDFIVWDGSTSMVGGSIYRASDAAAGSLVFNPTTRNISATGYTSVSVNEKFWATFVIGSTFFSV